MQKARSRLTRGSGKRGPGQPVALQILGGLRGPSAVCTFQPILIRTFTPHGQTLNRLLRHRAKPHQKKEQIHGAENVPRALSTRTSRYESRSEIWPLNLPTMSLRARKRGFGRSAALQILAGPQGPSAACALQLIPIRTFAPHGQALNRF